MERILVSACLLGVSCRYDGIGKADKNVLKLMDKYELIPVCPEIMGGLATPRDPAEIIDGRVITKGGRDVTAEYARGAEETLKLAKLYGCKKAILKERSPSCGFAKIYDGTFSHTEVEGNGLTANLLSENDIVVIGESNLHF